MYEYDPNDLDDDILDALGADDDHSPNLTLTR
jgi:hypothetical protein